MKIYEILNYFGFESADQREAKTLSLNSETVNSDTVFIALTGTKNRGADYVPAALKKGALICLSDTAVKMAFHVPDLKRRLTAFALWFYGHPERSLRLIGVTGTNGKSTTAFLVHMGLEALGRESLLITTTPGLPQSVLTANTTPYGAELAAIMAGAVCAGKKFVVMECSSIGIAEYKLSGLEFEVVLLTNLKRDHLDYHRTLRRYHQVKIDFAARQADRVITFADSARRLKIRRQVAPDKLHFADPRAIEIDRKTTELCFKYDGKIFETQFLFDYNARNFVLAYECLRALFDDIDAAVFKKIAPIRGRAEIVSNNPLVIIDYAHTASAFRTFIKAVRRTFPTQKLIIVFGAGGEREKEKRRDYGRAARRAAYLPIVTSDNSRHESFDQIAGMIVGKDKEKFLVVPDRKMAIKWACSLLDSDYALLLIGKGPETVTVENDQTSVLDEREEVKKWLTN